MTTPTYVAEVVDNDVFVVVRNVSCGVVYPSGRVCSSQGKFRDIHTARISRQANELFNGAPDPGVVERRCRFSGVVRGLLQPSFGFGTVGTGSKLADQKIEGSEARGRRYEVNIGTDIVGFGVCIAKRVCGKALHMCGVRVRGGAS